MVVKFKWCTIVVRVERLNVVRIIVERVATAVQFRELVLREQPANKVSCINI